VPPKWSCGFEAKWTLLETTIVLHAVLMTDRRASGERTCKLGFLGSLTSTSLAMLNPASPLPPIVELRQYTRSLARAR
jgi:hypothetical protein